MVPRSEYDTSSKPRPLKVAHRGQGLMPGVAMTDAGVSAFSAVAIARDATPDVQSLLPPSPTPTPIGKSCRAQSVGFKSGDKGHPGGTIEVRLVNGRTIKTDASIVPDVLAAIITEGAVVEVLALFLVGEQRLVLAPQIFARRHQEAAGTGRRIADDILRRRRHQLDHQLNNVPGRAELAVLAGAGDLGEEVFVEVALCIAILHGDRLDHIDYTAMKCWCRDREARALHVLRRALAANLLQPRENVVVEPVPHLTGFKVLDAGPAQVGVWDEIARAALALLLPFRKNRLHALRADTLSGHLVFSGLDLVQPLQEQQVGDLLDDLQRVRNAARPERIPNFIDLVAQFARKHVERCPPSLIPPSTDAADRNHKLRPGNMPEFLEFMPSIDAAVDVAYRAVKRKRIVVVFGGVRGLVYC